MAEATETTQASATGTAETQTAGQQGAPVSIIGADGKFATDWKNSLPEDIRGEKALDAFSDLPGAMKQLVHAQKRLGMEKIVKPGEKSTPEDWSDYYKAGGRPDAPEAYKIEPPKELAALYSDDTLKQARAVMHEAGLSQKQVDALMKWDSGRAMEALATQQQAQEEQRISVETDLRKEWGKDYEPNLHLANKMLSDNMTPEEVKELSGSMGNNKTLARLLANVAKNFMEDTPLSEEAVSGAGGIQEQIRALQLTPGYLEGSMAPAQRSGLQAQIDALYQKAYK
jgi:hypothetical protein